MDDKLEIDILCDNLVFEDKCIAEWGLSLFISFNNKKILFDTGYSFVFKHNAEIKNIDLNKTDYLVLSHFHEDHSGGLRFLKFKEKINIVLHPQLLEKMPKNEAVNIINNFNIISSEEPMEFENDIIYLGEIPRNNNFEKGLHKNDPIIDDSAIAINTKKGVVVISGCAHSGICNICEYAKKVTNQKIYSVIGGFHLLKDDEAADGTIEYFKKEKIEHLFPLHCIHASVFEKFSQTFDCKKMAVAEKITIDI